MWGVGRQEVQKKEYSRKGKLNEENSCTPINPKKIFMLWPKKNSCNQFDNEKKIPAARKFPSPHNFSNGPSLILSFLGRGAEELELRIQEDDSNLLDNASLRAYKFFPCFLVQ